MTWIAIVFALAAVLALLVRAIEPSLIYFPSRALERTPASMGLPFEELHLRAADGVRIHGWRVPAPRPDAPVVLLLHGNAGNISHRIEKIAMLHEVGAAVLIIDYRGYGASEGRPSERGLALDAEAAYTHLTGRDGVAAERIVVYGESLGTAVAVDLASTRRVAGLILEAAFTSARAVAAELYPMLPVRLVMRSRFDTLSKISQVEAPLLMLHGRDDEFFGVEHAQQVLAAARGPKRLVVLAGGHNDAFIVSRDAYLSALHEFLGKL